MRYKDNFKGKNPWLVVVLEADEGIQPRDMQSLYEQTVTVRLKNGTKLFSGICMGGGLANNGGYKQVRIKCYNKVVTGVANKIY